MNATSELSQAVRLHQAGRIAEAVAVYRQVLRAEPDNADARHLLGLAAHQGGDHAEAIQQIRKATELNPTCPAFFSNLAEAYRAGGDPKAAAAAARRALSLSPDFPPAHNNLGNALTAAGDFTGAAAAYRRAVGLRPEYPEALSNLARVLVELGELDEAERYCHRALAVRPTVEVRGTLATIFERQGRLNEAALCLADALAAAPGNVEMLLRLAAVHAAAGDDAAAVTCCRRAAALAPRSAAALARLATALLCTDDTAEAARRSAEAIELDPASSDAHSVAGALRLAEGRLVEAESEFRQALALPRPPVDAGLNLAATLRRQGRISDAVQTLQQALDRHPRERRLRLALVAALRDADRAPEAEAVIGQLLAAGDDSAEVHLAQANIDKELYRPERAVAHYRTAIERAGAAAAASKGRTRTHYQALAAEGQFLLAGLCTNQGLADEAAERFATAARHDGTLTSRFAAATVLPAIYDSREEILRWRTRLEQGLESLRRRGERFGPGDVPPEVFYLAYQAMNDRPIAETIAGLFPPPAPPRPRTAPGDGRIRVGFLSRHFRTHTIGKLAEGILTGLDRRAFRISVLSLGEHHDATAQRIRRTSERFVVLPPTIEPAAALIAAEELDVLVYTDVGMCPPIATLARRRLAAAQCVMWGHPVTTGMPSMDYFLSSRLIEPDDAAGHYREALVLFDRLPAYYARPPLPAPAPSRELFGLAADRRVYLCPQSLFKFHPDFDAAIGSILRQDGGGELVLLAGPHPEHVRRLGDRFQRTLPDCVGRIRFLPSVSREDYLRLLTVADAVLDPFHFGSGNSAYEALAVGAPVITWPGEFMRGRVVAGCYRQIGYEELIARDANDYVERALAVAGDRRRQQAARRAILDGAGELFDDRRFLAELGAFLTHAGRAA